MQVTAIRQSSYSLPGNIGEYKDAQLLMLMILNKMMDVSALAACDA